jgi:hypothetical protein
MLVNCGITQARIVHLVTYFFKLLILIKHVSKFESPGHGQNSRLLFICTVCVDDLC